MSSVLLLLPGENAPKTLPPVPFLDKLIHVILFGSISFALYFDFILKDKHKNEFLSILIYTYALLLFGGMVEVIQELFLHRSGTTSDFIADWIGISLGFFTAHFFARPFLVALQR